MGRVKIRTLSRIDSVHDAQAHGTSPACLDSGPGLALARLRTIDAIGGDRAPVKVHEHGQGAHEY